MVTVFVIVAIVVAVIVWASAAGTDKTTGAPKKADSPIIWTEEYDRAMKKLFAPVEEEPVVFVTGPGGTGKSILMREMEKRWRDRRPLARIAKLAPTGVAAAHIDGRTLHSFFLFNPEDFAPKSRVVEYFRAYFSGDNFLLPWQQEQMEECRWTALLLVDEISMVKPDLIDSMDKAMQALKRNSKPFGGCKVVFFGDLGQLPPIYDEKEQQLYLKEYGVKCPYFFEAHVIKNNPHFNPATWPVHLTRVFRQDDERFIAALQCLRCGELQVEDVELFDSRYDEQAVCVSTQERTTLFCTNAAVDQKNEECLDALPGPPKEFQLERKGIAVKFKSERFKYKDPLTLKIGARVMILKNHLPDYHNGTVGTVTDFRDGKIVVKVAKTGREFLIEKDTVEFLDPRQKEKVIGSYKQYPLKLAWAVTIHKSQGQTYDEVYVDVSNNFALGHVYTAFSRVRSLDGLHLLSPDYLPKTPIPKELRPWLRPVQQ